MTLITVKEEDGKFLGYHGAKLVTTQHSMEKALKKLLQYVKGQKL